MAAQLQPPEAHRPLLRVVVVGSVDDGKSTLLGRLLYECDGLYDDQIAAVRRKSRDGTLDLSLFTDGLLAEREQGITIDVAWRYLQTPRLKLVLADTPGHVQYTRNMATGASSADACIVLVDARLGVLQQTRRHAWIASLLGLRDLCVAINKIDLVEDPAAVFARLSRDVLGLTDRLGFTQVQVVPVSAVRGDNVVQPAPSAYYDGPTILSWLEALPEQQRALTSHAPMRLAVQRVVRPHLDYRGYAGTISSGRLAVGDELVVLPGGRRSRVEAIDTFDGELQSAIAPQAVTVRLRDDVDVARGDVLAEVARPPRVARRFEAELIWFAEEPLVPGQRLLLKHGSRTVGASVTKVQGRQDLDTLAEVLADTLQHNDIGRVRVECVLPLALDRYRELRDTGAFLLIDPTSHATLAAGLVSQIDEASADRAPTPSQTPSLPPSQSLPPSLPQSLPQSQSLPPPLPLPQSLPLIPTQTFPPALPPDLERHLHSLTKPQLLWLSGYAAGLAARDPAPAPAPTPTPIAPVTVLYGSQTGNGRALAAQLAERLGAAGVQTRVVNAKDYPLRSLAQEKLLVVVVSTHGDGDPPDDVRALHEQLHGRRAPALPGLRYAVVGLGDSSYTHFCATARAFDERLAALGAERLFPRVECDVDVAQGAATFLTEGVAKLTELWRAQQPSATPSVSAPQPPLPAPGPTTARVLTNLRLTARGTRKEVRHVELELEGDATYEPGDALLVHADARPEVVDDVLRGLGLDGAAELTHRGETRPLAGHLAGRELTRLLRPFVVAHQARVRRPDDRASLQSALDGDFAVWAGVRQLVDLLAEHPATWSAAELLEALRPAPPRAYSIASSPLVSPGEAHLTVAVVDDAGAPRRRLGRVSSALAGAGPDATLRVQLQRNERFRLPADPARDVIFIGPGTGVAPFRACLQHREATGATGRHWLFFGDQTIAGHFLYQTEWQAARARGSLHRLDVAFSRDQAAKLYVQHRLLERAEELWRWLQAGAHLYVCGDASRMAADVERALLQVAAGALGRDEEAAREWLAGLSAEGRYQRDVY